MNIHLSLDFVTFLCRSFRFGSLSICANNPVMREFVEGRLQQGLTIFFRWYVQGATGVFAIGVMLGFCHGSVFFLCCLCSVSVRVSIHYLCLGALDRGIGLP